MKPVCQIYNKKRKPETKAKKAKKLKKKKKKARDHIIRRKTNVNIKPN